MIVHLKKPSKTEAELVTSVAASEIAHLKLKRWSKKQKILTVAPVEVANDNGITLDTAVLAVDQKTGKLQLIRIEERTQEVPIDADAIELEGKGRR